MEQKPTPEQIKRCRKHYEEIVVPTMNKDDLWLWDGLNDEERDEYIWYEYFNLSYRQHHPTYNELHPGEDPKMHYEFKEHFREREIAIAGRYWEMVWLRFEVDEKDRIEELAKRLNLSLRDVVISAVNLLYENQKNK